MGAWEVGQLVIYEKTMQPFFISSNQQPSLLACDLFHRLLGDEESHVVPQSVLDIGRPWWWEQWCKWWWCSLWRWPSSQGVSPSSSSVLSSTQRAGWSKTLLRPAFWVAMLICHEFDSSAHLLWIRYTLMMHHLSWHQTWVAMLIYHEFDASAHCFLLLGAFDDDAIDWLLLNESQLQAWVKAPSSIHQQLPYFFLLHEGSSEFYAKPFPEPASQLADSEALWRVWCKLEKHQLVKDILAGCMNVDETRRRSCVDLWMGLEDMRGVSEKAAAEHCGWDLICGRGPRKGYNQKKSMVPMTCSQDCHWIWCDLIWQILWVTIRFW